MFLRTVATFLDVITLLACLVGGWQIYTAIIAPDANAVQVASGVVVGIGIAAIPYFVAGAFHRGAVRDLLVAARNRAE
jgi:hypothetical protein